MSNRRVRILMGKFGEGYESAMLHLARVFSEAGFEVIYTELQDPRAIVTSAIQESVDHIGITTLPGADIELFSGILALLKEMGAERVQVTAGGILPEEDIPRVKAMGVVEFFPRGTTYAELIDWSRKNIRPTDK